MNENKDMGFDEFLEALHKEGLMTYGVTYYENLKHLRELKKYKEMWRGLTDCAYRYRDISNNYTHLIDFMNDIKQKYFPKFNELIELERLFTELNNAVKKALNGI